MAKQKAVKTIDVAWQRYIWIGAALGLYFGLFFRPVREPSLAFVVWLSLAAAFVTVIIRVIRAKSFVWQTFIRDMVLAWAQFAFFLAMLEGRHLAYAWGGRVATAALGVVMGAISGLWYGYTQRKFEAQK